MITKSQSTQPTPSPPSQAPALMQCSDGPSRGRSRSGVVGWGEEMVTSSPQMSGRCGGVVELTCLLQPGVVPV